jgi:hypothetical protein
MTHPETTEGTEVGGESAEKEPLTRNRRDLLRLGFGAAAGAAGAAIALDASPAGAGAGSDIVIDNPNSGAGGVTQLTDSTFQATLQDAGGQVFDVRAFGATGGGTMDDTSAIQAAQSAAGAGCVYFPPGRYMVDGLAISTPGQTFKIESGATIILASGLSTPTAVITVIAPDVTITGPGVIDGNSSAYPSGGNGFDGVYFTTTTTPSPSSADDCQINGVTVQNVAYNGIRADGVQRTKIAFNQVTNFGHSGISSQTGSGASTFEGPLIIGNTVLSSASGVSTGVNVQGATSTELVNASRIIGNHVELGSTTGIVFQVFNCQYAKVTGNTGQGSVQVFSVVGGTDNIVSENTALALGHGAGIEFGSNWSVCSNNTVLCSGNGVGITADNSTGTHIAIHGNKVTNAQAQGIRVASYDHVSIVGNLVTQSTSANATDGVIEVSPTVTPTAIGLIVVGDNVIDGAGVSNYGISILSLISQSAQLSIHDNAITGIASAPPSLVSPTAVHFAGAGTVTDIVVHDNTIGSGIGLYSVATGLTLGTNVRFHDNIVVGTGVTGLSDLTLPVSGTPYVNNSPFREVVYLQGGKLTGTGANQGVVKNGRAFVSSNLKMTFPMAITLDPGESFTVYYTAAPNAWKDVKG